MFRVDISLYLINRIRALYLLLSLVVVLLSSSSACWNCCSIFFFFLYSSTPSPCTIYTCACYHLDLNDLFPCSIFDFISKWGGEGEWMRYEIENQILHISVLFLEKIISNEARINYIHYKNHQMLLISSKQLRRVIETTLFVCYVLCIWLLVSIK